MNINGSINMFDSEQAKSTNYSLLFELDMSQSNLEILQTERGYRILNFLYEGEDSLDLEVNSPCINTDGTLNWVIAWDSNISGVLKVYGNK